MTTYLLPPWPATPPAYGRIKLRAVTQDDIRMAQDLSTDLYVPKTGSLPAHATEDEALAWVKRQQGRHSEGAGFSFTIVDVTAGKAVGHCGLWVKELDEGRATAGYSVAPSARGRGLAADALSALTEFGWTVPGLFRIALYIEPWNLGSIRTAERAGYVYEGTLRSHHVIAGERRDMLLYAAVCPDQ